MSPDARRLDEDDDDRPKQSVLSMQQHQVLCDLATGARAMTTKRRILLAGAIN